MTTTAGKPQLDELLMVIDGSPRAARSGRTYTSTDPYTGQPWAQVPDADAQDVDAAVAAARAALGGPGASSPPPSAASCCTGSAS
jgi:NAD-dependent aldehyde dehydrogenases